MSLGYYALLTGKQLPLFQINLFPPFSGSTSPRILGTPDAVAACEFWVYKLCTHLCASVCVYIYIFTYA